MERTITITLKQTVWSGWEPKGYPIVTSAQVRAAEGTALTPATLGKEGVNYEVLVESIIADQAGFVFRGVVIDNPGGTINLSAPTAGQFILRRGESKNLSTPTMDAGTRITVTLDDITWSNTHRSVTDLQ